MSGTLRLASRCTMGVGGPAARIIQSDDPAVLIDALHAADDAGKPSFILGGGSNIVFHDEGFDGWIIHPTSTRIDFHDEGGHTRVIADAGVAWDTLVEGCVARGLVGLEAMSGIPGSVGAAPIQNIGAYGQELSDTLTNVHAYDRKKMEMTNHSHDACGFGYRDSRFKRAGAGAQLITRIELLLRRDEGPIALRYRDLRDHFGADHAPDASALRNAVLHIRASKGMVYRPEDPDSHSVGSFFMNPLLSPDDAAQLRERCAHAGLGEPPLYAQADGRLKSSAAWLIDRAGITRGHRHGGAAISRKHVLAITNPGEATAADVRELARHVQARVLDAWGVALTPEARILTPTGLDPSFYPDALPDEPTG